MVFLKMIRGTKRVRLIDIAAASHTSVAVVSQVLNGGHNNIGVCREKAEHIRRLAQEMNYQPNLLARSLVGRKSSLIGVYIDSEASYFVHSICASLFNVMKTKGYHLLIRTGHESFSEIKEANTAFNQYGVAATVIMSHSYDLEGSLDFLDLKHTVFFEKPRSVETDYFIDIDYAIAFAAGVRHLLTIGKRRLGLIATGTGFMTEAKIKGFLRQAKESAGQLETAEILRENELFLSEDNIKRKLDFIRDNRLDGVMVINDNYAAPLCHVCQANGLSVPKDVAIIGSDNFGFSEFIIPSLTTFDIDYAACGRQMAQMLLEIIENKPVTAQRMVVPKLVVRDSTVVNSPTAHLFHPHA